VSLKRVSQSILVVAMLAASFATTGTVFAGADCSTSYTVQPGDSLSSIAALCGTSVEDLRAANPGVGPWPQAGVVLNIPGGFASAPAPYAAMGYYPMQTSGGTYVVRPGDTLGTIAARYGVSLGALLAANPQILNPSLIYAGQPISLPGVYSGAPSNYYAPNYYLQPNAYPPNYYAPSYSPPGYYPSYYPSNYPPSGCPPNCVSASDSSSIIWPKYSPALGWRGLKVTYKYGLTVRTGPARYTGEIAGLYVEAIKGSTWTYLKGSTTIDKEGFVWVKVALPRTVDGYDTGWIVVKDGEGNYYTSPEIDP
jgi:LysM repeat protein